MLQVSRVYVGMGECTEHMRLCFAWRQPTSTYVVGSVVTGVSSMCNVIEYDLSKYKELVEALGEASIDVEAALDDFPINYGPAPRTTDSMRQEELGTWKTRKSNC